jgi:hypothetical protein
LFIGTKRLKADPEISEATVTNPIEPTTTVAGGSAEIWNRQPSQWPAVALSPETILGRFVSFRPFTITSDPKTTLKSTLAPMPDAYCNRAVIFGYS